MSNSTQKTQPPQVDVDQIIGLYNQGQLEQTVSLAESLAKQHPNALILYDILGAAYMGLKNADKTIESYQKALQLNPNHTDAHNNMGMALYDQGRFDEAVESYQRAVKLEPSFADAHYNLGNALKQTGDLKKAIESYKTSLAINPNDAEVLLNYGNTLKNYGEFDQAIAAYAQALKIDPNSMAAQTNMGNAIEEKTEIDENVSVYARVAKLEIISAEVISFNGLCLERKGYVDAAIESHKKALIIDPTCASAFFNIGNAHLQKGELEESIDSYKNCLKFEPNFIAAFENLEQLKIQMIKNLKNNKENHKFLNKMLLNLISKSLKIHILRAIKFFISENYQESLNCLYNYNSLLKDNKMEGKSEQDKKFYSGYADFLNRLIAKHPNSSVINKMKIYHIGDSHCLSYANCGLALGPNEFSIMPALTIGLKAYHLSQKNENKYKAITKYNLNSIPGQSIIFISVGEIDCRAYEGLIPTSQKTGTPLTELVQKTVSGYLTWFLNVNLTNKHKYFFFNVPAPIYREEFTLRKNQKVANVVHLFNETLKENLRKCSFGLIDVYEPTKAENGFSNNLYHCDKVHLDCRILDIIQDQIATSEMP